MNKNLKIDVDVERINDSPIAVFKIDGELDTVTYIDIFKPTLNAYKQQGFRRVIIDFSKLTVMTTSAIMGLCLSLKDCQSDMIYMVFCDMKPEMFENFKMYANTEFDYCHSKNDAYRKMATMERPS